MHNEDRELQIRLAELQADIQINLTVCFGLLAVFMAVMIGLEQIYFTLSPERVFEKLFIPIAISILAVMLLVYLRIFLKKADEARKELGKLKKQYIW